MLWVSEGVEYVMVSEGVEYVTSLAGRVKIKSPNN